jgi:hypothetical protein
VLDVKLIHQLPQLRSVLFECRLLLLAGRVFAVFCSLSLTLIGPFLIVDDIAELDLPLEVNAWCLRLQEFVHAPEIVVDRLDVGFV